MSDPRSGWLLDGDVAAAAGRAQALYGQQARGALAQLSARRLDRLGNLNFRGRRACCYAQHLTAAAA